MIDFGQTVRDLRVAKLRVRRKLAMRPRLDHKTSLGPWCAWESRSGSG